MRASAIEFRLRMLINAIIILMGFWTPWIGNGTAWAGFGPHVALLEWLALRMSRMGLTAFSDAVPTAIAVAALCAALGAVLRVWGTAYLGSGTVHSLEMRAGAVVASGPYRYLRNPLYLGLWFMVAALAFLMPPSGALFAMALITFFQLRLILGEEAFLTQRIGDSYLAYKRAVPRLVPRLRGAPAAAGEKPQWLRAFLTELTPIGVFVALTFFSWSYNNRMMVRVILIFFGISLVMRALLMGKHSEAETPKTYS
jgi:protein-S-isoprenylcysteine O-methyltransferase Ste14